MLNGLCFCKKQPERRKISDPNNWKKCHQRKLNEILKRSDRICQTLQQVTRANKESQFFRVLIQIMNSRICEEYN
uniref:Uncharacterized protein n=1 Tax=Romanomermis culicivorax TaxID=13658 RepID=A0A915HY31_ROMCU